MAAVPGPLDLDPVEKPPQRFTVDVSDEVAEFYDRLAALQNALATVDGVPLRRRVSRKSLIEKAINSQARVDLEALKKMFSELGEWPDADDTAALEKYAKRVSAWRSKSK